MLTVGKEDKYVDLFQIPTLLSFGLLETTLLPRQDHGSRKHLQIPPTPVRRVEQAR
jgi:hypothetical protein